MTRGSRLLETSDTAYSTVDETADTNSSSIEYHHLKHRVLGRHAARFVTKPDGTLLIAPGQEVTETILETAERWQILDDLLGEIEGFSLPLGQKHDSKTPHLSTSIARSTIA
ncbi:hypothetical protein CKA32_004634 [Geitlerinema sp. FC II]|nr:hypothetical protein CKA32_004634 [Geitlerinema sp. FC II]